MFEVSSCNQVTGIISVEDVEFGLKYEFNCADVVGAVVQGEYDLLITNSNGISRVIRILD